MTDFGASFKKARESHGVSLNQIAIETRISTRFLLAIDNEDFRLLPGGIFNRGFIRTYAQRVGLNPEQAVADYERLAQATEPDVLLRSAEPSPNATPRSFYIVSAGALVLLIAAFYIFTRSTNTVSVTASRPAVETAQPVVKTTARVAQRPEPERTESITVPVPEANEPAVATPATAPSPPALVLREPTPVGGETLALELEVHELTWIKVSTDGTAVLNRELQPGTTRRYTAQTSIDVVVGNAGGLTMKVNDKTVRPLGRSGQVRSLTITPNNLADITG